jgi:hypothetical protein
MLPLRGLTQERALVEIIEGVGGGPLAMMLAREVGFEAKWEVRARLRAGVLGKLDDTINGIDAVDTVSGVVTVGVTVVVTAVVTVVVTVVVVVVTSNVAVAADAVVVSAAAAAAEVVSREDAEKSGARGGGCWGRGGH